MEKAVIIKSHEDLFVWQKAMDLVVSVYHITDNFPKSEVYNLTSQMRRCAVSIPSNIAEGRRRGSKKEFRQFLVVAFGSGAELETQLEIARRLRYIQDTDDGDISITLDGVMRMLNKMISNLQATS